MLPLRKCIPEPDLPVQILARSLTSTEARGRITDVLRTSVVLSPKAARIIQASPSKQRSVPHSQLEPH